MIADSGPRDADGSPASPDRQIRHLVRHVSESWDHRADRLDQLLDRAAAALCEQANHELRQILTMVTTELELAEYRSPDEGRVELEPGTIDRIQEALTRGTEIVSTYLDRNEVAKLLIRIEPRTVNVADLLDDALAREGIEPERMPVTCALDPIEVEADREKLGTALGYLVSELSENRPPGSRLRVEVQSGEGRVEGFLALEPPPMSRGDLVQRIEGSLDIEEIGIDIPYVRAVLERHGGTLFVAQDDGALGWGFHLPLETPTVGDQP